MAKTYDPFAILTPKQLRRQLLAQLAPFLSSGSRAIGGYTDALTRALEPAARQTRATYSRAEQEQAAVDDALAKHLSGAGAALQGDLAAQLGAAGQSTDPASAVGQVGRGAAGAGYGRGSASLSQLISEGAAAENYSGHLPDIARLGGAQEQGQYRQSILSQLPQLLKDAQAQEFQKAIAIQSGLVSQAKLAQTASVDKARLRQGQQRIEQGQQSLDLRAQQQQTDNLLKEAGLNLRQDQYKLAIRRENRLAKGKARKSGGFTPGQISKLRATAIETVKDWKHGIPATTSASGTVTKPAIPGKPHDAHGAFRYLVLHGIPPTMADWAVGNVFGQWKRRGDQRSGY